MTGETILIVDDEPHIIELTEMYLAQEGFRVISAHDGRAALDLIAAERPALVVLDLMLPVLDGMDVCRQVRADKQTADLPILMLTARDDDIDKIVGLELGADDYVTKPFNPRELVARVKAILRRAARPSEVGIEDETVRVGDVVIDPARRTVAVRGQDVALRTREFDLLLALARSEGIVFSRDKLLDLVWGYDFYGQTRTVDVHVAHLREKLQGSAVSIETVWGVGYKLVGS
ncbi:MAG: response regulator transcription factor [Anaerolineae bacterium]|nr:response regulator transcription factor [Anaerolineae bacterium]